MLSAEAVPKSKKLLKLQVDFGTLGQRTVLAGIAESYLPENIVGMSIVAVLNLAPRMMMGIESHGMILATRDEAGMIHCVKGGLVPAGTEVG